MMKEQQARIEAHEKLRQSQPYTDATMRVQRITLDFVETVRAAWFFATRDPNSGKYVFWRFTDDLLGSALAIRMTSREGIDTVPRRELRFMLELAIRNAYVDLVYASAETSLDTRMAYVEHKLEGDIVASSSGSRPDAIPARGGQLPSSRAVACLSASRGELRLRPDRHPASV
jgi:hypothetical protein